MANEPFSEDIRKLPGDPDRRGAFLRGYKHGADRDHAAYGANALDRLTWQNLGYRLGCLFGPTPDDQVRELYEWCERQHGR